MNEEEIMQIVILDLNYNAKIKSMLIYADSYILVKGTITITGVRDDAAARQADE